MTNEQLAVLAAERMRQHATRTPGRRIASALHVALTTTKTPDAARRALGMFGDPAERDAARQLLDEFQRGAA